MLYTDDVGLIERDTLRPVAVPRPIKLDSAIPPASQADGSFHPAPGSTAGERGADGAAGVADHRQPRTAADQGDLPRRGDGGRGRSCAN